jgi:hypothetical protein
MSGTYQSRVFTFISKRTNRLKDTCAQGFRQIRVAVIWSSQILLYPIQLLAQKTKIFQHQIPQTPQQRSFIQPVSDINIEHALDLVLEAGYPIVIAERGSLTVEADRFSVGDAIAKANAPLPRTRNLVSMTKGSIPIYEDTSNLGHYDPDTEDWEVASYSPRRSSPVVAKKPTVRGISSLLIDRQLVLVTTANELLDILTISQQKEIRRRIGIDLAIDWHQWHTGELIDNSGHQQLSANRDLFLTDETSMQQLAIADSEENISSSSPTLFERWDNWLQSFKLKAPDEPLPISPEIEPKFLHQLSPADYSFTPQPPRIDRYLDLPQLPPVDEELETFSSDSLILDTISKLQPDWLKQWLNYYRDYIYIPSNEDSQIVHQPEKFQLIAIESNSEKKRSKQDLILINSSSDIVGGASPWENRASNNSSFQVEPASEYFQDWIDADSELIGYSKSPLARFLAWLDRLILYIENWLIKIWNIITNKSAPS